MQANVTPQLIFNADTMKFCAPFSKPELVLTITYMVFALVGCLCGLATFDKLDYFGFDQVAH